MSVQAAMLRAILERSAGSSVHVPERRFLDLPADFRQGTKVQVRDLPQERFPAEPFAGAGAPLSAFMLLDRYLASCHPSLAGRTSRERYRSLPRNNRSERLVAELYRILRLYDVVGMNGGTIRSESACVHLNHVVDSIAYSCRISLPGPELLVSFVHYYLSLPFRRDPPAYVEAVLSSYYNDIVDQIRNFHDEDANVLVFHTGVKINRHVRFICGDAPYRFDGDGHVTFGIEEYFRNRGTVPVDFYIEIDGELFIIPVEALDNGRLPRSELESWKAQNTEV
jgi:hypothetical protein